MSCWWKLRKSFFNRGDPYPTPKMPQRLLVKLLRDFNFNKTSLDCIIFHLHYFKRQIIMIVAKRYVKHNLQTTIKFLMT